MDKKIDHKLLEAIDKINGKGEPLVVVGATGSGKSTALGACAKDPVVQNLLSIREANGNGSLIETNVMITDYEEIPEDKLIMIAELNRQNTANCSDDNELLGDVLYTAINAYSKDLREDLYEKKILVALQNACRNPSNDSLAYRLKDMDNEKFCELAKIISKFPILEVKLLYEEMLAKNIRKSQAGIRVFTELLSLRESFKGFIDEFWKWTINYLNQDVEKLKSYIENNVCNVMERSEKGYQFVVILGEEHYDSKIAEILLKSENGSKEYLFSDISLIFRGANHIFNVPDAEALAVAKVNGTEIHCIRMIDTQGLFHATNVGVKDESERIIDLLSRYHTSQMLVVVNSLVTSVSKNACESIMTMLQEVNRNIETYILFTHWDGYLKSVADQKPENVHVDRFAWKDTNLEKEYKKACEEQEKLVAKFHEREQLNSSRKKPKIEGVYRAALLLFRGEIEKFLFENDVNYSIALKGLFTQIAKNAASKRNKYYVIENIRDCVRVDLAQIGKLQSISGLYKNLVIDCKGKKIYASTVRACTRKWMQIGEKHKSQVMTNESGFQNIDTVFVQEIRNYAKTFIDKLVIINVENYLLHQEEKDDFLKELKEYFGKNIDRQVAKTIGNEAYREGFLHAKDFRYQYQRFTDMLQYTQENYFMAERIPFTGKFEKCLLEAAEKCISDFVDAKCIVVY